MGLIVCPLKFDARISTALSATCCNASTVKFICYTTFIFMIMRNYNYAEEDMLQLCNLVPGSSSALQTSVVLERNTETRIQSESRYDRDLRHRDRRNRWGSRKKQLRRAVLPFRKIRSGDAK